MKNKYEPALKGSIKYIKHKCLVYQIVDLPCMKMKSHPIVELMGLKGAYQAILIMN